MTRVLNGPGDVDTYRENRQIFRKLNFARTPNHPQAPIPGVGGRVIEGRWGAVYALDETGAPTNVVLHPAEEVSFAENIEGGWDKATSLRLS